jgi:hypothetical protein
VGGLVFGPERGPRGLSPSILLGDVVEARGLEMERLFRRLDPPAPGPWYRAADDDPVPPETLAGPLVVWALARGGPDPDFLAAAAASLARLTHRDPSHLAGAVYMALAVLAAAVGGVVAASEGEWVARAERWGGAAPPDRVRAAWRAAAAHPRDLAGSCDAARAAGVDPGLAGTLVGIVVGSDTAPGELGALAGALRAASAPP